MTRARKESVELLLAERATEGLDPGREAELGRLLEAHPGWVDDTFDLAAAAIYEAMARSEGELPGHLRARLRDTASGFTAARSSGAPVYSAATVADDPAEARDRFLAASPDALRIDWRPTADPAASGAAGDVVWSPTRSAGFLRLRGLATNQPSATQYQLWVFDAARDARYPVDGGVFDMPAGADEVVVPIRTPVDVVDAELFAVTVERPGGVVVSDRERVVLLAPVAD